MLLQNPQVPEIGELLGKQIFLSMPMSKFARCYKNNMQDPAKEKVLKTVYIGDSAYHFLSGDYVVVENDLGLWSLYEGSKRTQAREHIEAWARFARGTWTRVVPSRPGTYATKDKLGCRAANRTLIEAGTGVRDVSKGYVASGKVTEWVGHWWTEPFPPLPDSI